MGNSLMANDATANGGTMSPATDPKGRAASGLGSLIYVVDDDPIQIAFLEASLARCGHVVVGFDDGESALVAALQSPPDVWVVDIRMPRIDGLEMLNRIKAASAGKARVMMITGGGRLDRIAQAISAGADDYLMKPFAPLEAAQKIHTLATRPSAAPPANDTDATR